MREVTIDEKTLRILAEAAKHTHAVYMRDEGFLAGPNTVRNAVQDAEYALVWGSSGSR